MLEAFLEVTARFIVWFLLEFLFYSVCYPLGWLILKVITIGRYPPPAPQNHNRDLVAGVPLVVALVAVTVAFS